MQSIDLARRLARIEAEHAGSSKARRTAAGQLVRRMRGAYIIRDGRVVGYRLPDGSTACRKRRYRDEAAALVELARIRHTATHAYIPARVYRCGYCKGFHLTSRA